MAYLKTYSLFIVSVLLNCNFTYTQNPILHQRELYKPTIEEARELYMRSLMSDSLNLNYNNLFLDTTEINRIFHQMNLVDQFLYSDNSFHRIRNIRPQQSYSVKEFMIKPNLDTLDLSKNEQLEYIALPKELEAFMRKYDFHFIYLFMNIKPGENWYGMRTYRDYNFHALAKELRRLEVIKYVDYYGGIRMGDGSRYDFDFKGDTTICTISIGWGDCPAGCINRRFWEFTIFNDYVTHSRTYGSGVKSKKK